jgi:hypothetical protein
MRLARSPLLCLPRDSVSASHQPRLLTGFRFLRGAQVLGRLEHTEHQLVLANAGPSSSPPGSPQLLQRATVQEATPHGPQHRQQQAGSASGCSFSCLAPSLTGPSQHLVGEGGSGSSGGSSCSRPSGGTLRETSHKRPTGVPAGVATADSGAGLSLGGRTRAAPAWLGQSSALVTSSGSSALKINAVAAARLALSFPCLPFWSCMPASLACTQLAWLIACCSICS